jgi:WD40 repeat protein
VSWSSDGTRLASSGNDGLGRVWDAETGEMLFTLIGHAAVVRDIEWSPDGTLLATAGGDGLARIWESVAGRELLALGGGDADIMGVSWSPDGQRLVVGGGVASRVWDVSTPMVRLVGHTAGEYDSIMTNYPYWSPDSRWAGTGGPNENAYRIWDPITGKNLKTFDAVTVAQASINSAGTEIFLVNPVRIVNLETGEAHSFPQPEEFGAGQDAVLASWSPDGKYLVMQNGVDPEYAIYEVETQELIFSSSQRCTFNAPLFWSPNSQVLAQTCFSGEYTSVLVTEALTGEVVREFHGHTDAIVFADWSPDSTRLATASFDKTVRVWDFETGETLIVFTGHAAGVFDVDWSPDGTRLVSGDTAGNVLVWDAETGEEVNRYNVGGSIVFLEWSPDGTRVLTTGVFDAPDIHPVWQSTGDLITYARECCVFRDLTPEEREQFGLAGRGR